MERHVDARHIRHQKRCREAGLISLRSLAESAITSTEWSGATPARRSGHRYRIPTVRKGEHVSTYLYGRAGIAVSRHRTRSTSSLPIPPPPHQLIVMGSPRPRTKSSPAMATAHRGTRSPGTVRIVDCVVAQHAAHELRLE